MKDIAQDTLRAFRNAANMIQSFIAQAPNHKNKIVDQ